MAASCWGSYGQAVAAVVDGVVGANVTERGESAASDLGGWLAVALHATDLTVGGFHAGACPSQTHVAFVPARHVPAVLSDDVDHRSVGFVGMDIFNDVSGAGEMVTVSTGVRAGSRRRRIDHRAGRRTH